MTTFYSSRSSASSSTSSYYSNNSYLTHCEDDLQVVLLPSIEHRVQTTIRHWQLRDLISCPKTKEEFYYVYQNNVRKYNTVTRQSTSILEDLHFVPTSMTANCDYVAAGGQRSELVVVPASGGPKTSLYLGGSINNALHIAPRRPPPPSPRPRALAPSRSTEVEPKDEDDHRMDEDRIEGEAAELDRELMERNQSNSGPLLFVSNNDTSLRIVSLPSMQVVERITLSAPVNYASPSPDGQYIAACGDCSQVSIYKQTESDTYHLAHVLYAGTELMFSCSWSPSSDKLAVAMQDGYVFVWDIPRMELLARLGSKQLPNPLRSACRSVKFAPVPAMDLLAFSEHTTYVHLVDTRTFAHQQILHVTDEQSNNPNIAGIAFSPDSRRLFVGLESCVLEYVIDTATRRAFPLGTLR